MRSRLDGARIRNSVFEGAIEFLSEGLAITAAFAIAEGMPGVIALDPASTGRNVTPYTPAVTGIFKRHEIYNISTGTGALTVKAKDGVTTIGTLNPSEMGRLTWIPSLGDWKLYKEAAGDSTTVGAETTFQQYTTLAALANSQVFALAIPFSFKLLGIGFRTRVVASTAAKAATLTGQVNGVSVTGGAVSLTTANQNTSGGLTAGTAITAGNTGTAGQSIGAVVSGVTAFVEGDGYVEYTVLNTG